MCYNRSRGRTWKLDVIKEMGKFHTYMAVLKCSKMLPGLDPGCIIAYLSHYIERL